MIEEGEGDGTEEKAVVWVFVVRNLLWSSGVERVIFEAGFIEIEEYESASLGL